MPAPYEPPAIESREAVLPALIGVLPSPVASPVWRRPEGNPTEED